MRFQRIFDQQMKVQKIRVKNMLLNKIKQVVQLIDLIRMNMKLIANSYCTSVKNLSLRKKTTILKHFQFVKKKQNTFFNKIDCLIMI